MCKGSTNLNSVNAIQISETEVILTDATIDYLKKVWASKKQENPAVTAHEICHVLSHAGLTAVLRPLIDGKNLF